MRSGAMRRGKARLYLSFFSLQQGAYVTGVSDYNEEGKYRGKAQIYKIVTCECSPGW